MLKRIGNVATILVGSLLMGVGFNYFLVPHQLLSGGVSGIAMILGYITSWDISLFFLLLNLPIIIWGFAILGKRFIMLSVVSILTTTLALRVIPIKPLADDPLLSAVFGAIITGIGIGISLRVGGSTGGFDIIGSIIIRKRDFPLGTLLFALNSVVILVQGFYLGDWDTALRSMLSIYLTSKVVDMIHISHIKVTVFIFTRKKEQLVEQLLRLPHGVTAVKAEGAFSGKENDMLITVTSRYELAELRKIIRDTDPDAFVNIVETVGIMGKFNRPGIT